MIVRDGRIVALSPERITVRFEKADACGACRAAKACAGNTPSTDIELPRPASLVAGVGGTVRVGLGDGEALRAAAVVYATPILGLVLGMALAAMLGLREDLVAAASCMGLGAGLWLMRRLAARPANRPAPVLIDYPDTPTPDSD